MPLTEQFTVIALPEPSDSVTTAFEHLPQDPYTPGGHRSRRFSPFKLTYEEVDAIWKLEELPHRPFMQSRDHNTLVGGVSRKLPPLTIDPSHQIDAACRAMGLDTAYAWHINVHQIRVIATPGIRGVLVPEGLHRDGHELVMIAVYARENIEGGETQLIPNEGGEPFFRITLNPNQALIFDDTAMLHYATDIVPLTPAGGHRDLWIVAMNKWENRRYGPEYEAAAAASARDSLDARQKMTSPSDSRSPSG
jgi:hypothetical protein